MLEEAGCELAGWPLDPAEQDPLVPLRPLVVAGGLTVAVNGIVRIQAGVRGWIARREYGKVVAFLEDLCGWIARRAYGGPFWDCFPEDFQRAVVCIETGVRGWIARRRVALYRRWHALEEKEARAEAMSRLRTAAFAAARAARQAHVDKGTARRAASVANARAAADLASASLAVDHAVAVLGEQAAGAAAVRIQACWRRQLGHRRYILWESELYDPDDGPADTRRRKRSQRACTGRKAAALRDAEWVAKKRGHNKHRGVRKGGKGGQKARAAAAAAAAGAQAPARLPERTADNFAEEIAANSAAVASMMREEDCEETEAPVRIRMRAHTAWLLAGATGPEPPGWTSPEERAHYEHLWHRVPMSRMCDDDWDGGAERGAMPDGDDTYAAYDVYDAYDGAP